MRLEIAHTSSLLCSPLRPAYFAVWFVCVFGFQFTQLKAQTNLPTGKGFVYSQEKIYDFRLHSNRGIGFFYQKGKIDTYYKTTFYQFGLSELRSAKEYKQGSDPALTRTFRPFVYGKRNTVFALRGSYGTKRYFSEKAKRKGVAVGMSSTFGGTLGLVKPYYLALRRPAVDQPGVSRVVSEKYSADNADLFLDESRIIGASSFVKGINELSIAPGANASVAMHLDWGAFDSMVKGMEVGAMVDFFPTKLPLLVLEDNQRLFLNFYVSVQLGRRK
jgi:hypothetical protein